MGAGPTHGRGRRILRGVAVACAVIGVGAIAAAVMGVPTERVLAGARAYDAVTLRFDAVVDRKLPWKVRPVEPEIRLPVGQVVDIEYEVQNLASRPTAAVATYTIGPDVAGVYVSKLDCFCREEQDLGAGERRLVTVTLFVDPEIRQDEAAGKAGAITLSYTFFPVAGPDEGNRAARAETLAKPTRQL
ncbi:cytochrome c oxidase assembly protein subunit 11 [Amorphus suaedae]